MLSINNLTVRFNSGNDLARPMVDQVNLNLEKGRTLAVIGETGSGKSLMGLSICKLLPESAHVEGTITFNNKSLLDLSPSQMRKYLGEHIAYVPQSAGLSLNPTMRCDRQVAEVYRTHQSLPAHVATGCAHKLLTTLGLDSGIRYPHVLSGGMKQRVLVGIGLASNPELLIADEPTKGLDRELRDDVANMFMELRNTNPDLALLIITHDLNLAEMISDDVAVMYAGQVLEQSKSSDFFTAPKHPYSQALLSALPERGLHPLAGIAPRHDEILQGCSFHPRCSNTGSDCSFKRPIAVGTATNSVCCWNHA